MRVIDKRNSDKNLTKFSDLLVGDVFELPDDDAVYMKVDVGCHRGSFADCTEFDFQGPCVGRISAIPLSHSATRPHEKYIVVERSTKVRVLDAELVINKEIVR